MEKIKIIIIKIICMIENETNFCHFLIYLWQTSFLNINFKLVHKKKLTEIRMLKHKLVI